ncbi:hypothetical protein SAMN04487911_12218 [Arenibacter nanhaiticus]|uniref:Beta-lactamase-inhibitor-like, PepSY-like n=1 Tax=Arenibacter nanhaiticus TaxID=558155 RepID=A0A1M6JIT1_9FLAO|nr:hypothetical protein [Arenibacter nanhaiticus]SHJ46609.1 hypothetical protein SAMN04487911_12218 [Arenibacter nanhaiticus]
MKSLVFATAMAIGSLHNVTAAPPIFHDGIMEAIFGMDYTEIKIKSVPNTIIKALEKDYPGAIIEKAYLDDAEGYKLEVSLENGSELELYADSKGNWIES